MFGWLKSLFGSESAQEPIVVPPLPKTRKKVEKKVEKAPVEKKAKKPAVKKLVGSTKKKKEVLETVAVIDPVAVVETATAPKKKGGRPKKSS